MADNLEKDTSVKTVELQKVAETNPSEYQADTDYYNQRQVSNDEVETRKKVELRQVEAELGKEGRSFWEDIGNGIKEAPKQVAGGILDFSNESVKFVGSAINWLDARLPETLKKVSDDVRGFELDEETLQQNVLPTLGPPETVTGGLVRGGTQFLTGFVPLFGQVTKGSKAFQLAKSSPKLMSFINASVAGFGTDVAGFDPEAPNAANLLVSVIGQGEGADLLDEYLATKPGDSEAKNRLKNGLQGILLGIVSEGAFRGMGKAFDTFIDTIEKAKGTKVYKAIDEQIEHVVKPIKDFDAQAKTIAKKVEGEKLVEGATSNKEIRALSRAQEETLEEAANRVLSRDKVRLKQVDQIPFKQQYGKKIFKGEKDFGELQKPAAERLKVDKKTLNRISTRIKQGDLESIDEAIDINLDKLDTTDDIKEVINTIADELQPSLKDAKVTNAEVKEMAEFMGTSADDINNMFKNVVGGNLKSAFLAARHMLIKSADDLVNKASLAQTGNLDAILSMRRAIARHTGIQHQISGVKTEIARTLQAMKIEANSGLARLNQIDTLITSFGGLDANQTFARRLLTLADSPDGLKKVMGALRPNKFAATRDALLEMYINGLLSRPVTHLVNFGGNSTTMAFSIAERFAAESIGGGATGVVKGESIAMLNGLVRGLGRAWKLAAQSFRKDRPSDYLVKTDYFRPHHRAISGEAFDASGFLGQALDALGTATRVPGRLLMASDDFFKTINYDMHLNSLAYRKATKLAGNNADDFARIYSDVMSGIDEKINMESLDFARYNTFTEQLADKTVSRSVQQVIQNDPTGLLKSFVPFFQTPVNIMRFTFHRTPIAGKLSRVVRAELASSDPAIRQLAQAKLRVGGMAYATGLGLAIGGYITGAPPRDRNSATRARDSGWRPYSIVTPNGYIPYNRLDPLGMVLGLAADFYQGGQLLTEAISQSKEGEEFHEEAIERYQEAGLVLLFSIYHNLSDRHYFAGLSEMFEMLSGEEAGLRRFATRFPNLVPPLSFYSGMRKGVRDSVDPTLRDTKAEELFDELGNILYNEIPGLSDGLIPQFNILGEPKLRMGGDVSRAWRPFNNLGNPMKGSTRSNNLLENEIRRLDVAVSGMETVKTIDNVPLEPEEKAFFAKEWGDLNKELQSELTSSDYLNRPDPRKKLMLEERILKNRRTAAKFTRIKFSRIQDEAIKLRDETEEALDQPNINPPVPSLIQR